MRWIALHPSIGVVSLVQAMPRRRRGRPCSDLRIDYSTSILCNWEEVTKFEGIGGRLGGSTVNRGWIRGGRTSCNVELKLASFAPGPLRRLISQAVGTLADGWT